MKAFIAKSSIIKYMILILLLGVCMQYMADTAYAAVKKQKVSAKDLADGLQLTFVDMPYSGVYSPIKTYKGKTITFSGIQNFEFTPDGKYIFTSGKCFTGSTMHTMLIRCRMPKKLGKKATAQCLEPMVLGRYGHGEVLAITQDDLKKEVYNIWVGCDPEKEVDAHATSIARLTYKVNANGNGKISKTVKIKGFRKANVINGKAAFFKDKVAPSWVIAALDRENNQAVFRLRFPEGYGCVFVAYDFKKLNSALNKIKNNGTYKIQNAAKWQVARIRCSRSMQSFDVMDNKLYMTDGHMGEKAMVYVVSYKTEKNELLTDQVRYEDKDFTKIIDVKPRITVGGVVYNKDTLEIEGIKVRKRKNGKVDYFINFVKKGTGLRDTLTLYKFTR